MRSEDTGNDSNTSIRLATRGSALALWQATRVADLIRAAAPATQVELVVVSTSPDRKPETPLAKLGGDKGLFVAEVEQAIRDGRADAAVHSLKDVPAEIPADMALVAIPEREDPRDALLTNGGLTLTQLPQGAHVGTSALRRRGQLLRLRPDLRISEIRGNVDTRVRKLRDGQFDAIVLAGAGLRRLGLALEITELLSLDDMLCAAGQGAIAIEAPADSPHTQLWRKLDHPHVRTCIQTERQLTSLLGADCNSAVGCLCEVDHGELRLRAVVVHPNGEKVLTFNDHISVCAANTLATSAANYLLANGAKALMQQQ